MMINKNPGLEEIEPDRESFRVILQLECHFCGDYEEVEDSMEETTDKANKDGWRNYTSAKYYSYKPLSSL